MRQIVFHVLLMWLPGCVYASSWQSEIQTAAGLTQEGRYGPAESHLRAAIRLASNDGQAATTWNNLGSVYVDMGRYQEAENALRRSLRLWDKYSGADSEAKANALNSLGGLLVDQGRIKEAERYIAMSLELRRNSPTGLDVTPALNNLALVKLAQRRYREAQALLADALARCEGAGRPCTVARAPIHHNLARTLTGLGRDRESIPFFLASIAAGEEAFGPSHPKLGWTYFELASVSMKLGNDALAASFFEKILTMRKSHRLGPHPLVTVTLERYSRLLKRQNRNAESRALMRQARAMKAELVDQNRLEGHAVELGSLRNFR